MEWAPGVPKAERQRTYELKENRVFPEAGRRRLSAGAFRADPRLLATWTRRGAKSP